MSEHHSKVAQCIYLLAGALFKKYIHGATVGQIVQFIELLQHGDIKNPGKFKVSNRGTAKQIVRFFRETVLSAFPVTTNRELAGYQLNKLYRWEKGEPTPALSCNGTTSSHKWEDILQSFNYWLKYGKRDEVIHALPLFRFEYNVEDSVTHHLARTNLFVQAIQECDVAAFEEIKKPSFSCRVAGYGKPELVQPMDLCRWECDYFERFRRAWDGPLQVCWIQKQVDDGHPYAIDAGDTRANEFRRQYVDATINVGQEYLEKSGIDLPRYLARSRNRKGPCQ